MRAALYLAVLALTPWDACADFTGRVVKVADGDTLTVLVKKRQVRVRLDGIDAPESGQAFSKRSQQSHVRGQAGAREGSRQGSLRPHCRPG